MSPGEVLIVLVAVCAGALVKAVTGMGLPVIAVPVISLFVGVEDAVVVMAIPSVASNGLLWFHARHHAGETRDLPRLALTGMLGAVAGTLLLVSLPERPLLVVLAVTVLFAVVTFARHPELRIGPEASRRWSPVVGGTAGVLHGATGISGPVYASWLHAYRLRPDAYVFSVTALFFLAGAVQLVLLLASGRFTAGRWMGAAAALVPTLAMVPLGTRLRDRLRGRAFDAAVLVVLGVSAGALLVRTLA